MAVEWVRERWDGRQGGGNASAEVSAQKQYLIKTNSKTDSEFDVLSDGLVPAFGDAHPVVPELIIDDIRISQRSESPFFWNLTVKYTNKREGVNAGKLDGDTPSTSQGGSGGAASPTSLEPEISWSTEQYQVPCDVDINNYGVVNSAGDPFDPLPMKDESRLTCTIEIQSATVPSWLLTYSDAINNTAITIDGISIDQYQAKVQSIQVGKVQQLGTETFRTVTLSISILEDTWIKKVLDQGFRAALTGADNFALHNIVDDDGNEISSPALLDGFGFELRNPSADTAVFLPFHIYNEKDFTVLPGVT